MFSPMGAKNIFPGKHISVWEVIDFSANVRQKINTERTLENLP